MVEGQNRLVFWENEEKVVFIQTDSQKLVMKVIQRKEVGER